MDIILNYENNIIGGVIMNINLTTKERLLLEDQKSHEQLCIQKYSNYENLASDQQLKNIFKGNGQKEQEHLNTINQLLNGQVPSMQMKPQQMQQSKSFNPQSSYTSFQNSDKELCSDLLMTEKYVSGSYDTAIFELKDTQVRAVLNHIQKEEQQYGESIFNYMQNKGGIQAKRVIKKYRA